MRVCVVLEQRFCQTPDKSVWTDSAFVRRFWNRYLAVFEEVRVIARVRQVPEPPLHAERADGNGVEFAAIPNFLGPLQYAIRQTAVRRAVRRAVEPDDAVLLRVPSQLGTILFPALQRDSRPYAVEVVGDPYEVFAPGGVSHPLRPFFRRWLTRNLQRQCRGACAASYVTAQSLQRRYPPSPSALSIHCSSVQLDGFLASSARRISPKPSWRLLTVGSLAQLYKGTDTLLEALALCTSQGLDLELVVVGDGKFRSQLERQAAAAGLRERAHFRGQLSPGDAISAELAEADLFVLPSRTEGLPRAMIEAMASALPCIGSRVGGIPELLPPEDMVPANNPQALAWAIREVLTSPERMAHMSQRNLQRVQEYREDALVERRTTFYRHLRTEMTGWLLRGHRQQRRSARVALRQYLSKWAPHHRTEVRSRSS